MSKLRLDKYLADMGVGTRQEVKALVRKGRVAVDGITAKAPELKVDPDEAQVTAVLSLYTHLTLPTKRVV